jgi:hypothetical protein
MKLLFALVVIGVAQFSCSSRAVASCAPQTPLHMWPHELRDLEKAVYKVLPPNMEIDADATDVCSGRPRDAARLESRHVRTSSGEESWWQVTCARGFREWNCSSVRKARMRVPVGQQHVALVATISNDTPLTTATELVRRAARVLDEPVPELMRCGGPAGRHDVQWPDARARALAAADLQPVVWAENNVADVSFAHDAGVAIHFRMAAGDSPRLVAECWREDVEVVVVD